jgi:hypothetical protein
VSRALRIARVLVFTGLGASCDGLVTDQGASSGTARPQSSMRRRGGSRLDAFVSNADDGDAPTPEDLE